MLDGNDAALEPVNDLDIVGGQEHGRAIFINLLEQTHDIPAVLRVEVASGLISDKNLGLAHDGTGNRHPLALTTTELVRELLLFAPEANEVDHLRYCVLDLTVTHTCNLQRKSDVLKDGALRQQLKILKHHTNLAAQQWNMLIFQGVVVDTTDHNLARCGLLFASEELEQRTLARPARANNNDELIGLNVQAHPIKRRLGVLIIPFGYSV